MAEIDKAIELYEKTFDDSFPTIPVLRDKSKIEVMEIINKCISEGKDVYDMGYLSLDNDSIY
ncbi:hypothetical protein HMPREF0889_1407 [Megasphaera lornae]|uniref:Uncharacterized protein n=2 Tax=Megasphaera lornae TaxID=1000568 RepID=D3LTV7_9FIRM|nr:hypothetical protein HMPREF0889_1407 [Megasphaera genomosp. type_1 str. 28L]